MDKPMATLEVRGVTKLSVKQIGDLIVWLEQQASKLNDESYAYSDLYKATIYKR